METTFQFIPKLDKQFLCPNLHAALFPIKFHFGVFMFGRVLGKSRRQFCRFPQCPIPCQINFRKSRFDDNSFVAKIKCCDEEGLLKYCCPDIKHEILKHFNVALRSGDVRRLKNWRPIAILPIMYKLFAPLLYNRISHTLFEWQSEHQHAFTPNRRIEDALLYAVLVIEYALEFNTLV